MMNWAEVMPVAGAAFLGSLVECVEALTIVLAVGVTRGWRPALAGAFAGIAVLAAAVAILGPMISAIALGEFQVAVGVLLLLFGMRWLRKAVLRAAGAIALHDEAAIYAAEAERLRSAYGRSVRAVDLIAGATAFKSVLIEGLEVAFIVLAVATKGALLAPAVVGAATAAVFVAILGVALHRPLARVLENALKFSVGVLISAFGIFWIGEGFGFPWPGVDGSIPVMIVILLVCALAAVGIVKAKRVPKRSSFA